MSDSLLERLQSNGNLQQSNHTPDVLSCLANLSNDEVFTPPEVVNQMLDMLPRELFSDPNTKFLDPACKTGVFLREIAKRLLVGLEPIYPNLQERIDHIFHEQLYGIAITELTSLLSRRSLYCSKYPNGKYSISHFDSSEGNIRFKKIDHKWGKLITDSNGKKKRYCEFCGASDDQWERGSSLESHAYEFIHTLKPEEIYKMNFDVIISNPPYQLADGGSGPSASPLYDKFVESAKKLNPRYISMIIPSRWFAGGKGLDDFREDMLNDGHIKKMVDYVNSADCFTGVDIAGGINYFLWSREYAGECEVTTVRGNKQTTTIRKLNEYDIFIRSNESLPIISKIEQSGDQMVEEYAFTRNPFGFESKSRGQSKDTRHNIMLFHSQGMGYVGIDDVIKNKNAVSKWKVSIGKLVPSNGEVGVDPEKGYNAMTQPRVLPKNAVITDSYLVLAAFDTKKEAVNFAKYMSNKFPRFLMHETYSSMNISKSNLRFVPYLDFNREWTDEDLYQRYGLTNEEISFVENMIRPMEPAEEYHAD